MVKVKEDLVGRVFGRLTVLEQAEDYIDSHGEHYAQWLCECSCSEHNNIIVRGTDLKRNDKKAIKSCGCLQKEDVIKTGNENAKPMCENPDLKLNLFDEEHNEFYGTCTAYNTGELYYFSMDFYDKLKDTCPHIQIDHKGRSRLIVYDKSKKRNVALLAFLGLRGWDHVNFENTLDNRKSNLRPATPSEQGRNKCLPKNNTSGVKGVGWDKQHQKWSAYIVIDGRIVRLGLFEDKTDAIKTRLKAELQYFGEFSLQKHLYEQYGITATS